MSLISVRNLTFGYDSNLENIFENTSFDIDTDWKLGFIGRNGRGKTTFLKLLMGKYKYSGTISASTTFDYFPFETAAEEITLKAARNIVAPFSKWEQKMDECLMENSESSLIRYGELLNMYTSNDGYIIDELIEKELGKLGIEKDVLNRPLYTLSSGEQTKVMLAAMFLKKNNFLLIDEPTNHLDMEGRIAVADYLNSKKGFILVSHDRHFLDSVVDHILSINKSSIEVQKGNFSSWQHNKNLKNNFEMSENEKLKKEISKLEEAARRTAGWSSKTESSKIGGHVPDRGYVGHKAAKMMKRAKSIEKRKDKSIESKKKLLKDIEKNEELKIIPMEYHKNTLINAENLTVGYGIRKIFENVSFQVNRGDRIAIRGRNGSGKSSILKLLNGENIPCTGAISIGNGLTVSYVPQDTSFLKGSMSEFIESENLDGSIFRMLLAKLDTGSEVFDRKLESLSGGQKKKVLIAKSLSQSAHIYIWDEPLNFIDVLSRMQIEELIRTYSPTMIFVEHDYAFNNNIATKVVELDI